MKCHFKFITVVHIYRNDENQYQEKLTLLLNSISLLIIIQVLLATRGLSHSLSILFDSRTDKHVIFSPIILKNDPSASEHFKSLHLPYAQGQFVATFPVSEQLRFFLFSLAHLQMKGRKRPPADCSTLDL